AVVASRRLAQVGFADPAVAIGSDLAVLAVLARLARAAAVDVGLVAVLDPVVARGGLALVVEADHRHAVPREDAVLAVVAGGAVEAAAVHVGLGAVLDAVVAGGAATGAAHQAHLGGAVAPVVAQLAVVAATA